MALLRGINVGGRNKVVMVDLRDVVASLGFADVVTYIQSGNVVFTSADADTTRLAARLETAIAERLGVRPTVVVLSSAELARVVAANPYPDETDPKCLHAVFLNEEMGPDEVAAVTTAQQRARDKGSRDEAQAVGRILFLRTLDGLGRSELAEQLSRTAVGRRGTTRNWATVGKLLELCGG